MTSHMTMLQHATLDRLVAKPFGTTACRARPSRRQSAVLASQSEGAVSRRESLASGLTAFAAAALVAQPAQAFLGIGEGQQKEDDYKEFTSSVIADVKNALALPRDDEKRTEAIQKIRDETTQWVAKYRRDNQFGGRASYGNTYSALSALAGHFNSFGPETPVPKKRLERITKELSDAEKLIARGR